MLRKSPNYFIASSPATTIYLFNFLRRVLAAAVFSFAPNIRPEQWICKFYLLLAFTAIQRLNRVNCISYLRTMCRCVSLGRWKDKIRFGVARIWCDQKWIKRIYFVFTLLCMRVCVTGRNRNDEFPKFTLVSYGWRLEHIHKWPSSSVVVVVGSDILEMSKSPVENIYWERTRERVREEKRREDTEITHRHTNDECSDKMDNGHVINVFTRWKNGGFVREKFTYPLHSILHKRVSHITLTDWVTVNEGPHHIISPFQYLHDDKISNQLWLQ